MGAPAILRRFHTLHIQINPSLQYLVNRQVNAERAAEHKAKVARQKAAYEAEVNEAK